MGIFQSVFLFLRAFIMGRAAAAVENVALRQQVAVFKQSVKRPKLRPRDRVFWVLLSRLWRNWRSARLREQYRAMRAEIEADPEIKKKPGSLPARPATYRPRDRWPAALTVQFPRARRSAPRAAASWWTEQSN